MSLGLLGLFLLIPYSPQTLDNAESSLSFKNLDRQMFHCSLINFEAKTVYLLI